MDKLNVHHYDGQWGDVDQYISKVRTIPQAIKIEKIASLKKRLVGHHKITSVAINNFTTISFADTYDPSNKIYVYDLLYILEELCKGYEDPTDLLNMIGEQLDDMSSGLCAQGRTTRLYQLMISFVREEIFDECP
jgi:hypothetical protein